MSVDKEERSVSRRQKDRSTSREKENRSTSRISERPSSRRSRYYLCLHSLFLEII